MGDNLFGNFHKPFSDLKILLVRYRRQLNRGFLQL